MEKNKEKALFIKAEKIRKEKLATFITEEFRRRQKERLQTEAQWTLNRKYYLGEQYCDVMPDGDIREIPPDYVWQPRRIYNHIAPLTESKLAKLSRVRPIVAVRPAGDDEEDYASAAVSEKILASSKERLGLDGVISKVTEYSEIFGTGFYKIIWDNDGGEKISEDGLDEDMPKTGDVCVTAVMPYAVYPDSLNNEELEDCNSLIHACVMSEEEAERLYGVKQSGDKSDVKEEKGIPVIEYYEKKSKDYPNGRMVTVCGGSVVYEGELPFINGDDGERTFPFVKQVSVNETGKFFGGSVIKRLIPVQRAYNAVKNRKQEFLNRMSMGILTVEDGSVDTDDLESYGLEPGRILIYRQGSEKPEMMKETTLPPEFEKEEDKLLKEFNTVSGVNDLSVAGISASSASGTALEMLFAQDNERVSLPAENMRRSLKSVYKHILRLYRQFAQFRRKAFINKKSGEVDVFTFSGKDITSDDVEIISENELLYTPTQKKSMILELYKSGLISKNCGLDVKTKSKILGLLGYPDLDEGKELRELHGKKADTENEILLKEYVGVEDLDDHDIHIENHTAYYLAEYERLLENAEQRERLKRHIAEHKNAKNSLSKEGEFEKADNTADIK